MNSEPPCILVATRIGLVQWECQWVAKVILHLSRWQVTKLVRRQFHSKLIAITRVEQPKPIMDVTIHMLSDCTVRKMCSQWQSVCFPGPTVTGVKEFAKRGKQRFWPLKPWEAGPLGHLSDQSFYVFIFRW